MTSVEVCSFCRRQIDPPDRELTPAGPLHAGCARQVDDLVASADFAAPGPRCAPGPPAGTDLDAWVTAWARTLTRHPDLPVDEAEMRSWFMAAIEAGRASGDAF